ncbi:MAG: protein adenylyltransferase SelO family protein, partial [Cyanobium sp.]
GQLELFARRARSNAHPGALRELQMITAHLIARNYRGEIHGELPFHEQVLQLAERFRGRLISLVANWMRVGYCQGNFNSDNCAAGGYTLDYGPFGFMELFDPRFQPWTGGGEHFCFFNQPQAAEVNYGMFVKSLRPLLDNNSEALARLDALRHGFAEGMAEAMERMWAGKLGLSRYEAQLVQELLQLLASSRADYTIAFRRLAELAADPAAAIPEQLSTLKQSFYLPSSQELDGRWNQWLGEWRQRIAVDGDFATTSRAMKRVNPAITWREWLIAPAYEQAAQGDTSLIQELQGLFDRPYAEPPAALAARYDRLRPLDFFNAGGVSHYSCSS